MKKTLAALVFGGLVFNSAFGAVHSVGGIAQKGEGDFLLASEINSILKTISGFLFDDASQILEFGGAIKATNFIKSDGSPLEEQIFNNIFESGENVGIGTSSPDAKLEIEMPGNGTWGNSYVRLGEMAEKDKTGVLVYNSSDSVFLGLESRDETKNNNYNTILRFGDDADDDFQIQESDNRVLMTIKNGGNVGIGTTNPGAKLEVVGDIKTSGANRRISDENGDWSVGGTGENLEFREPEQENKVWGYFQDDWGLHLTGAPNLATSGHVRIRNTSPTLYLTDSNNRSGMIHMNSNLMYFLRGKGTGSEEWQSHNGKWPLYLNLENNNAYFGNEVHATKFVGDGSGLTNLPSSSSSSINFDLDDGDITFKGTNQKMELSYKNRLDGNYGSLQNSRKNFEHWSLFWNAYYDWNTNEFKFQKNNFQGALEFSMREGAGFDFNIKNGPATAGKAFNWTRTAMRIKNNGNVGIGTTSPSEKLHVSGKVKATSFVNSSDRTKKQNIKSLENSLEVVQTLRGVEFEWKENGQKSIGFLAQEVEEILPEIVHGEEGEKSVEYGNLTAILIEAVKAQQAQIEDLKKEVASLKK